MAEDVASRLWAAAEPIVVPYDGSATELFVLDLPRSHMRHVLEHFAEWAEQVAAATESCQGEALDEAVISAYASTAPNFAIFEGTRPKEGNVQLHLGLGEGLQYDLELVFWSDLWFPPTQSAEEHYRRFVELIQFAEFIRQGSPRSTCMLAGEYNGDPRDLLGRPGIVVW